MRDFMNIAKALSDESRVRMLMAVYGGELCVCQLTELVELSPSTVSKHMSILKHAGLVKGRKDGRWVYYGLPGDDVSDLVHRALEWVRASIKKDPIVLADERRLKEILKLDPEELCRQQSQTLQSSPSRSPEEMKT